MKRGEIYVVTDIEADGPIPGPNSMRSLGSVAVTKSGEEVGTFTFNLEPLPDATADQETMKWWLEHLEAWRASNENRQAPEVALPQYADWLEGLPGRPVFVAWPVAYDFMFTYWYLHRFAGRSPFGWSALDTKTLAMVYAGTGYLDSAPKLRQVLPRQENPHIALLDAKIEAATFLQLLKLVREGQRLL